MYNSGRWYLRDSSYGQQVESAETSADAPTFSVLISKIIQILDGRQNVAMEIKIIESNPHVLSKN